MKVLLVRHGISENLPPGQDGVKVNSQRALTGPGKKKMRRAAEGLMRMVERPDLIVSSPLLRAHQTAEILADVFKIDKIATTAALSPGKRPNELLAYLKSHGDSKPGSQAGGALVIVVGHEPDLGLFTSWSLTGLTESFIEFRKGGMCLLEFPAEARPGRAKLLWMCRPRQLRQLAR